jgi:hypothetical protein
VVAGYKPTDTSLIVIDPTYAFGPGPEVYGLEVRTGDAVALCATTCTSSQVNANQTLVSNDPIAPSGAPDLQLFTAFFYDVTTADGITGIDLAWNVPIVGALMSSDGDIVGNFSYVPNVGFDASWSAYRGLVRHRTPGRYYFAVFDPTGTPGADTITATTQLAVRTPTAIMQGTVTPMQPVDAFASNALTYNAGTTDAWHQLDAIGTNSGNLSLAFFNPTVAYGRLDGLIASASTTPDVTPIFTRLVPQGGSASGRVVLDDQTTTYLVTVNTSTVVSGSAFALDFRRRDHDDMGSPTDMTINTNLTTSHPLHRVVFRAAPGSQITIGVTTASGALDPVIALVNNDEVDVTVQDANGAGSSETLSFEQPAAGYTAFVVRSATAVSGTNGVSIHVIATGP